MTLGTVLDALEDPEQLADATHQQPLLVDLDPGARGGGKHDVITRLDGHLHADVIPPIEARADRQHNALLWRRLVGARGNEQTGAPHPVGVELLDDDPVENWAKAMAHE
jgi:hypothetical protein